MSYLCDRYDSVKHQTSSRMSYVHRRAEAPCQGLVQYAEITGNSMYDHQSLSLEKPR